MIMKRLIPILLCLAFSACTGFSDGDNGGKTDSGSVKLAETITLGYEENGTETVELMCRLEYDDNNRLKTFIDYEDEGSVFVTNFIYESDKVILTEEYMEDGNIKSYTTTYEFENGKLQRVTDDEGFAGVLQYDAGGEKPMMYETNYGVNYEFSWDNHGNLTKIAGKTELSWFFEQYTFSKVQDKCNVDLRAVFESDINGLPILFDKEVFKCISSPYLPNDVIYNGGTSSWTYKFDDDGYPVEIMETGKDHEYEYTSFLRISYRAANQQ